MLTTMKCRVLFPTLSNFNIFYFYCLECIFNTAQFVRVYFAYLLKFILDLIVLLIFIALIVSHKNA